MSLTPTPAPDQPFWAFLQAPLTELIVTIIGVLITEVALYYYFKRHEKPKINIETIRKDEKLGFTVSVGKKMIKDARIRCNNINYTWDDGASRRDLFVGDTPSIFYPFETKIKYAEDITEYPHWGLNKTELESGTGIIVSVVEITTQKTVYVEGIPIPKNSDFLFLDGRYSNKPLLKVSIRIIGEGIEEEKDYTLHIGLSNLLIPAIKEGKPIMDYAKCTFQLKKKWRFK